VTVRARIGALVARVKTSSHGSATREPVRRPSRRRHAAGDATGKNVSRPMHVLSRCPAISAMRRFARRWFMQGLSSLGGLHILVNSAGRQQSHDSILDISTGSSTGRYVPISSRCSDASSVHLARQNWRTFQPATWPPFLCRAARQGIFRRKLIQSYSVCRLKTAESCSREM
jgi:hypothetical protein